MSAPLIVLDTDVVVTALLGREDADSYRVVRRVMTGEVQLAASNPFVVELLEVVRRPHVRRNIRDVPKAFEIGLELGLWAHFCNPTRYDWPSVRDPDDYWLPDLAWEAEADYIIALDPHLLEANFPFPIEVLTPSQLLERLEMVS